MAKRARRPAFDVRLTELKEVALQACDYYKWARSAILSGDPEIHAADFQKPLEDTHYWFCERAGMHRGHYVLDYVERSAAVADMSAFCGYETAIEAAGDLVHRLGLLLRRLELGEYDLLELKGLVAALPAVDQLPIRDRILDEYRAALKRFDGSSPSEKAGGPKRHELPLDEIALAVYFTHHDWTKKQIADHLGLPPQSLAPKRCPQLTNAIRGNREDAGNLLTGSKGSDGAIEAWER